ncbi:MAG TPA: uroporphyrinogen-III synthase [Allosphingosinicella sp.]|nr:uroporphyrinogen-III synthase [Allosphingosinicella sp.]
MSRAVLVLRPEPGASATAERARRLGLEPVVAPLFKVRPLAWEAPGRPGLDGILLTSAHAPRQAGPLLEQYLHLPCHAVGEATAAAAAQAGFADVRAGPRDAAALLATMGKSRLLHLCGRDHLSLERTEVELVRRIVYAADAVDALPAEARRMLASGGLVLLHSPRAARTFAALVDAAGLPRARVAVAAISAAAAAAAGGGWSRIESAAHPRDEALLELAAELCQTERQVRE